MQPNPGLNLDRAQPIGFQTEIAALDSIDIEYQPSIVDSDLT